MCKEQSHRPECFLDAKAFTRLQQTQAQPLQCSDSQTQLLVHAMLLDT